MKVAGKVSRIFANDWNGRNGTIKLYSFKVEGNDKFYRLGEQEPQFRETDYVEFDADDKGKVSNLVVSKDKAASGEGTAPAGRAVGASSGRTAGRGGSFQKAAGGGSREDYWQDKEQRDIAREQRQHEIVEPRITYCSARSDAVQIVKAALEHDLLAFGNANKSAKLGLLLGYVDQVTQKFAQDAMRAHEILSGEGATTTESEQEPEYDDNSLDD